MTRRRPTQASLFDRIRAANRIWNSNAPIAGSAASSRWAASPSQFRQALETLTFTARSFVRAEEIGHDLMGGGRLDARPGDARRILKHAALANEKARDKSRAFH